ncbi:MAG: Hsp20/alpha crystallin family protein [Gemmatimonadales bacterium]
MKLTKLSRPAAPPGAPRLDRLFERLFAVPFGMDLEDMTMAWTPAMDLSETETSFVARVEAPGVKKEDLDVTVEQNVLTVSGKRERSEERDTEEQIWREREVGRFVRSVRLPQTVNAKDVQAAFTDGVLTVTMPKAAEALTSRVPVS